MSDAGNVNFRALQLFIAVYDSQSFSVVARPGRRFALDGVARHSPA
ncbi:transcriptional regulator [Klebsiella michiganensis]|nr:transcriptional regulator [Klebsiella michiganensis]